MILFSQSVAITSQHVWALGVTITNKGDPDDYPRVAIASLPYKCTVRWSLDSVVKHLVVALQEVTGTTSQVLSTHVLYNLTQGLYEHTFVVRAPASKGTWRLFVFVNSSSSADFFEYAVNVEELIHGFDFIARNELSSVWYQSGDSKNTDMLFSKTSVETTRVEESWAHADRDSGRAYAAFFLSPPGSYRVKWNAYLNNSRVKQLGEINLYVPDTRLVEYSIVSEIPSPHSLFLYDTGALIYVLSRDPSLPRSHYELVADISYGFDRSFYSPGDSGAFFVRLRPRGLGYYIPIAGVAFYVLKQHTLEVVAYAKARISLTIINETFTFKLPFVVDHNAEPNDRRIIICLAMRDRFLEDRITYHIAYEDTFEIRQRSRSPFDLFFEQLFEIIKDFGRELFLSVLATLVASVLIYRYRRLKRKTERRAS